MSKKKEEKAVVVLDKDNTITTAKKDELLKKLGTFKDEVEVTANYLESEPGEEIVCWFVGITKMPGIEDSSEKVDAVKLLLDNGNYAVSASTVLVGTLMDLIDEECGGLSLPLPVKIIMTKEKKSSGNRKYFDWKIFLLS